MWVRLGAGGEVIAGRDWGMAMCRWMAYSGDPILAEILLFQPQHSLIDQSLHSRLGVETTNGAVGVIEDVGRRHRIPNPIQMTVATSDGSSIWAFRYSSERRSRSLF